MLVSDCENILTYRCFGGIIKLLTDHEHRSLPGGLISGLATAPPRYSGMALRIEIEATSKRLVSQAPRSLAGVHQGGVAS